MKGRICFQSLIFMTCIGCVKNKNEALDSSDRNTDSGIEADSGTKTDSGIDADTDPSDEIDPSILGSWSRELLLETEDGALDITWTSSEDGSCMVLINSPEGTDDISCSFTAAEGAFSMYDEDCESEGFGQYTYVIANNRLSFTLIDDACEGRSAALPSAWLRME